jgi:hypothetical protein
VLYGDNQNMLQAIRHQPHVWHLPHCAGRVPLWRHCRCRC